MLIVSVILSAILIVALLWLCSRKQPVGPSHGTGMPGQRILRQPTSTLVVGSFNVHRARGLDGRKDLGRIANHLVEIDVAGLYEVEGGIGPADNQSNQLAGKLDCAALYLPTQKRWLHHDRGNALLSRVAIGDWYCEPLVDSTGRRPRMLFNTSIQLGDESIQLFVTHLSRHCDQEIQFATVMQRLRNYPRVILIGDLNVTREFEPLQSALERGELHDAVGEVCGGRGNQRIDWILSRGLIVEDGGEVDEGASDHPFYWVKVRLQ